MKRYPLDLQFFAGEKTEKATPQKRQESRKKGQVAKSQEVAAALIMLGGILLLSFLGDWMLDQLLAIYRINYIQYISWEITPDTIRLMFEQLAMDAFLARGLVVAGCVRGAWRRGRAAAARIIRRPWRRRCRRYW